MLLGNSVQDYAGIPENPLARLLRFELGNPLRDHSYGFVEGDGTAFVSVFDPTVNSGESFSVHRTTSVTGMSESSDIGGIDHLDSRAAC